MSAARSGTAGRGGTNGSDLTDRLCTACGLCCDGSLLADVELAGDEAAGLEILGLEVEEPDEDHAGLLLLPCGALRGTRCSIYAHRPGCCRTFECRLLQGARRGLVDVEGALATIADARARVARVQSLAAGLGPAGEGLPLKERCAEALAGSESGPGDPESRRKRGELEAEMGALEVVLRENFL